METYPNRKYRQLAMLFVAGLILTSIPYLYALVNEIIFLLHLTADDRDFHARIATRQSLIIVGCFMVLGWWTLVGLLHRREWVSRGVMALALFAFAMAIQGLSMLPLWNVPTSVHQVHVIIARNTILPTLAMIWAIAMLRLALIYPQVSLELPAANPSPPAPAK